MLKNQKNKNRGIIECYWIGRKDVVVKRNKKQKNKKREIIECGGEGERGVFGNRNKKLEKIEK